MTKWNFELTLRQVVKLVSWVDSLSLECDWKNTPWVYGYDVNPFIPKLTHLWLEELE